MDEETIGLRRLLMAIIIQSLKDIQSSDPEARKDAEVWFQKRSVRPFGFAYCLEYSGINDRTVEHLLNDQERKNLIKIMQVERSFL